MGPGNNLCCPQNQEEGLLVKVIYTTMITFELLTYPALLLVRLKSFTTEWATRRGIISST